MTTQISNIKKEIFVTKEHYLHFRQAWKDYINSGKAKPTFVEDAYRGRIKYSNLTGAQHLLFNILTEKDVSVTFKPSTNESKQGFWNAYHKLIGIHTKINMAALDDGKKPSYSTQAQYDERVASRQKAIEDFFEPFGKSFTVEMFDRVMVEFLKPAKFTNKVDVAVVTEKAA